MIYGGWGMFPHYMDERYFLLDFYPWSVDSIGGVTLRPGWAEQLRWMLSAYMLCACNYLRIMWMGGGWIGVPVVACLGHDENTWPLGVGTFQEVWHCVFLPRTPIDFLLHLVLGAGMYNPEDGSEVGVFQFKRVRYEARMSEGCLGSFLTFSGYACDWTIDGVACYRDNGGMKGDYVGAVAHEKRHVVGWWRQFMMGDWRQLRDLSGYMRHFFEVFGVRFGLAGECRVHCSQEWFFKKPSPILWGVFQW